MISLRLVQPSNPFAATARKERQQLLDQLDSLLREKFLGCKAHRHEARLWLVADIAQLSVSDKRTKRRALAGLVSDSSRSGRERPASYTAQLLRLLCEHRASQLCALLGDSPNTLRDFFDGRSTHASLWFSQFGSAASGLAQPGGQALARYALKHRDEVWQLLVWSGKHPQAPVSVAAKPHYFRELDIVRSVQNFVQQCPAFWSSEELREALADGQLPTLDYDYFCEHLGRVLSCGGAPARQLEQLLHDFLEEAPFQLLCQRLLPVLDDADLLAFINRLAPALERCTAALLSLNHGRVLEAATFGAGSWRRLDDLLLADALGLHAQQLWRLLQPESEQALVTQLRTLQKCSEGGAWGVLQSAAAASCNKLQSLLVLEAWALHMYLWQCQDLQDKQCMQMLLQHNGITFTAPRLTNQESGRSPKQAMRHRKRKHQAKTHKRHKKKRKKRRKDLQLDYGSSSEDDLSASEDELDSEPTELQSADWTIQLGEELITCLQADIIQHLVSYAVRCWLIACQA